MSLQHTAHHLAAQGRNGDSMLMHVTPHEVSGLQALAQQHGGSLTVNPHTGLPEANILDDIGLGAVNKFVPAIAGAGLSFFSGGAIDPMTAAGMVGGLAGLSSGSLKEGIMAGLGAYGGAGLTGSLGEMGGAANASAANSAAQTAGLSDAERVSAIQAAAKPDISAGLSSVAAHPMDFLKNNKYAIGAAALPALMGAMEQTNSGPMALTNKGYIRRYAKNPVTGALEQVEAVPVDEFKDRSAVSFGGVGTPTKYAAGGATDSAVTFGGVGQTKSVIDPNDTRQDSQKAYDYLMGKPGAENPMLFYHDKGPLVPLDLKTRTGGHYVLNESTNSYDWVPDPAPAASKIEAGLPALVVGPQGGAGRGGMADAGLNGVSSAGGGSSGRLGEIGAVANNAISNAGLVALGKIANAFSLGDTNSYSPAVSDAQGISNDGGGTTSAMGGGFGPGGDGGGAGASMGGPNGGGFGPTSGNGPGPGGDGGGAGGGAGGSGPGTGGAGGSGVGNAQGGFFHKGKFNFHPDQMYAQGGYTHMASGGLGSLGGYSDGGQLLKGPGDGVSDSIPATIGHGQPARLADGEFVIPARIVSELGNGSTEAGAKQLYAMMARIQAGRAKTTGKNQVAKNSKADRHLPA